MATAGHPKPTPPLCRLITNTHGAAHRNGLRELAVLALLSAAFVTLTWRSGGHVECRPAGDAELPARFFRLPMPRVIATLPPAASCVTYAGATDARAAALACAAFIGVCQHSRRLCHPWSSVAESS